MWFLMERKGDEVTLHVPAPDRFKAEVAAGRMKGRIKDDVVILDSPNAKVMSFLGSDKGRDLFMPETMTLRRITAE